MPTIANQHGSALQLSEGRTANPPSAQDCGQGLGSLAIGAPCCGWESQEAIRNINIGGDKLVIKQEGISISGTGGSIHGSGSGNIFVAGTINVGGRQGGVTMQFKSRCIVGIALPEAPSIRITGSGDVTLYDLQQAVLDLGVQGSGDITAFGRVDLLDAEVAGSGDLDASELVAVRQTVGGRLRRHRRLCQ